MDGLTEASRAAADEAPHRCYSTERWAKAVVLVLGSAEDPRTLAQWGRLAGASRGTLVNWCRGALASPRRSLELARMLRAIALTRGDLSELQDVLDIVEPRTVKRLLERARVMANDHPISLIAFLEVQQLIRKPRLVGTLKALLRERLDISQGQHHDE